MQILDLKGGSGATYRFRLVAEPGDLPAHAGNFVRIASPVAKNAVLAFGTRRSLRELSSIWGELQEDDARLFVRLNVSLATRLAEHDDLVAVLPSTLVMREHD